MDSSFYEFRVDNRSYEAPVLNDAPLTRRRAAQENEQPL
jgi:hypothetical protein